MAEKKSQLAEVLKELKESSERSIERQKELEKVTTAISQWMIDQEITEDQNMSEIFQQIEKIPELQSALLELKKNVWKLEETQQITTAESKVLQQLLESVKHAERKQKQKHDNDTKSLLSVTETTDTTFVPRECELLLSQVIQIDIHNPVKLVIKVDDKLKINPKKNSYISEIKSLADNSCVAKPLIFDSSTSRLSTVFKPVMRGRHQFHIKASNNKPIKGIKPFEFFVKQSPDTLSHPVRVIEGLNYPYNVHVVPNSSTMLVSECKSHCVTIMDKNTGKRLNTIGGLTGVIKIPNGIATDLQGFVYVVDSGNHCVHTFTLEGTPIDKQGNKGNAHTDFHYPYGIGISPHNGTINICDHNNDRVKIFSHDMKFQKMIHAVTPYDIAFDKKGHTYVTDNSNHLVAVFNEQFHCINSISGKGTEVGKLLEPRGIAIDDEDHIYVVEELNCRVSIFNTRGELITCFGQEGNQPGQFNSPQGIHVDDDSYIYICDMLNNRVQVF
jgi:DNA-binding beta-propeller fold protein YncE